MIQLTPAQEICRDTVADFLVNRASRREKIMLFIGPAGTGKTVVLRDLTSMFDRSGMVVGVVSYTGRAVMQLSLDGVPARTCHSLLYRVKLDPVTNAPIGWARKSIPEILEVCRDGLIVDEGSMIPFDMHIYFMELGIPIIYCGDDMQLDPVEQNPEKQWFCAMSSFDDTVPRIELTENHRFSKDSGIGRLASHLREMNSIPRLNRKDISIIKKDDVKKLPFHDSNEFDVIITGTNETRQLMNDLVRCARGFTGIVPEAGERIVCLENMVLDDGRRINNGEIFTVTARFPMDGESKFLVRSENDVSYTIIVADDFWRAEEDPKGYPSGVGNSRCKFAYGYAMSCHKVQGSTFRRVLFIDEDVSFFLDRQKFRYTGVTRAAEHLTVAR